MPILTLNSKIKNPKEFNSSGYNTETSDLILKNQYSCYLHAKAVSTIGNNLFWFDLTLG